MKILFRLKEKKLLFNFKPIENVNINEIIARVIDKPREAINKANMLRKIKTSKQTIHINTSQIKLGDAPELIKDLIQIALQNNIKIISSWDELKIKRK